MAKNAVVVKFLADIDGLKKGVNSVDKQLSGFGKSLKVLGTAMVAAFSTRAITDFTKESILLASDLEESFGKVDTIFQSNAINVKQWSEDSVQQLGLTQQQALEAAGSFGNLFTSMGVGIPEAEELSTSLVQLATDLASLNNTSIDEALTALRSGLAGETEPLKRFAVQISAAEVKTKALTLGLIEQGEELDNAAKAQATYALIMERSTNAQGDFERTGDGLANQLRKMNAQATETKTAFGVGFLNAMGGADGATKDVTRSLEALEVILEDIGETAGGVAKDISEAFGPVATVIEEINKDWDDQNVAIRAIRFAWRLGSTDLNQLTKEIIENDFSWANNADITYTAAEAAREAAFAQRGAAAEAKALTDALNENTNAWALNVAANPGSAEIRRQSRVMDSFGRAIDKQGIQWKNMTEANRLYWETLNVGTKTAGGGTRKLSEDIEDQGKKVKNFTAEIGDFTLSVAQKAAKGKKISADAITAMTEAGQAAIQGLLDELEAAEVKLVETQRFIAEQTAAFLGPTSITAVQQAYAAAKSEAEQLMRAYERAKEARLKAEGNEESAEAIAALRQAEKEAQNAADKANKNAAKGFTGFWEEAQDAVVAYRGEIDRLRESFASDGLITDAEAQILKDVFTLPPETGTQVINQLLTDTGKALTDNQQQIINDTNAWMVVITDTFEGKNGFPAVGYTAASTMVTDLNKELRDPDTKEKIRKAVRAAVPKSVKVRVKWEYDAFVPPVPGVVSASSGSRAVASIQEYERMNGTKWRDRVR